MAAKKKSVPSKNKPGPWDDIARGAKAAGGAVKRTVVSNPGNRNKASNIDKWLNGGNYSHRGLTDKEVAAGIVKGAKAVAKAADTIVRKVTPLPDRDANVRKLMKITPEMRARRAAKKNASVPKAKKK